MSKFLKIHSYNGAIHLVNTSMIVRIYKNKNDETVIVLNEIKDGNNVSIIDSIASVETYSKTLNASGHDFGQFQ